RRTSDSGWFCRLLNLQRQHPTRSRALRLDSEGREGFARRARRHESAFQPPTNCHSFSTSGCGTKLTPHPFHEVQRVNSSIALVIGSCPGPAYLGCLRSHRRSDWLAWLTLM